MRRGPFGRFPYRRRGPFGRPIPQRGRGPLVPGRSLNPRVQRQLRRANHLMAQGDHLAAAETFLNIAHHAQDRGIVYPAPMLFMQAAHAYLLGEQYALSVVQARLGLEILAAQGRWGPFQHEGQHYLEQLEAAGQSQPAAELKSWLDGQMEGHSVEPPAAKQQLPEKCPYCGASMSLEHINAGGTRAAECQYCGSVVLPRSQE